MAKKTKKQKLPPEHVKVTVPIKSAKVDRLMVPVVNWLNSFEDVWTSSCCEGYDEDELSDEPDEQGGMVCHEPYVVFSCDSLDSLIAIFQKIESGEYDETVFARGEIDWHSLGQNGFGRLVYCLRFYNKSRLREFIAERLSNKPSPKRPFKGMAIKHSAIGSRDV